MGRQEIQITQQHNTGTVVASENQKAPEKKSVSLSGLAAVMFAMSTSIPSLQKLSAGILGVSAMITKTNGDLTTEWLKIIATGKDSDQAKIREVTNSHEKVKTKSEKLSVLSSQYQQHNMEYQQSQTFWTSMNDTTQKQGASTSQAMDIIEDFGGAILSTVYNLTNILA